MTPDTFYWFSAVCFAAACAGAVGAIGVEREARRRNEQQWWRERFWPRDSVGTAMFARRLFGRNGRAK